MHERLASESGSQEWLVKRCTYLGKSVNGSSKCAVSFYKRQAGRKHAGLTSTNAPRALYSALALRGLRLPLCGDASDVHSERAGFRNNSTLFDYYKR
jgi:hypothetical protein